MPSFKQITHRFLMWLSCVLISIVMVVQVSAGAISAPQNSPCEQQVGARLEDDAGHAVAAHAQFISAEFSEEETESSADLDLQPVSEHIHPPRDLFSNCASARGPPETSLSLHTVPFDPRRAIISLLFDRGPPLNMA